MAYSFVTIAGLSHMSSLRIYHRMVCLVSASYRPALFVLPSPSVLLFLLRIFLSPRSVGRFPLLVFLTLRPIEVILSVAVRPLGPLITVYQVNSQIYGDWASDAF